jgi:adenine-specific DNA-methyltransferase
MSRLTELIRQAKEKDPALGAELEREYRTLSGRRAFGLNFERHRPEAVELPSRRVRWGDKVRVLPPRGSTDRGDQRLWRVARIERTDGERLAHLEPLGDDEREATTVAADDLVVVAEFRDPIHPGLVPTGGVQRGGDKPAHTVINGENFHVLKALTYTHRGKVDAIYIDPPYNTGAKDWKYNNDYVEGDDLYRHSKWLAFMERRLLLAKELLNPADSVLIVTIDEKEYLRLGLLLEQTFPEAAIQMVSTLVNPANVPRAGFGRSDEYLFFVMQGDAGPRRVRLSREWVSGRGRTHTGNIRWDLLRRSGPGATRADSPGGFYAIYVDPVGPKVAAVGDALPNGVHEAEHLEGAVAVLPIRRDGSEGRWQWTSSTLRSRLEQGRVRITGSEDRGFTVSILKDGEFGKVQRGEFDVIGHNPDGSIIVGDVDTSTVLAIPGSQWRVSSHDSTQYGSRLLAELLSGRTFPFPKSLYAVEDALRFFVSEKPDAVVLDFFAGSGTTAQAVMRLNKQDGGRRQCISVTNKWEALGICDHITKPRIEAAITGRTPDGEPIKGDYKFTDEFPMADGFEENAEFFTLTYENPVAIGHNRAFERIAPLLWLRAGAEGRRIDTVPDGGWDVADTYGICWDLDQAGDFAHAVEKGERVRLAYVVTDDDRRFQSVARQLPEGVEVVRLYESYLSNFRFTGSEP